MTAAIFFSTCCKSLNAETMEKKKTYRGFDITEFTDTYGNECSLQKSSIATDDRIWLGVNDAKPQIMASRAKHHGVETTATNGWVDYPISDEVTLHTRMHLNREQVKELLPYLKRFVKTGDLW